MQENENRRMESAGEWRERLNGECGRTVGAREREQRVRENRECWSAGEQGVLRNRECL